MKCYDKHDPVSGPPSGRIGDKSVPTPSSHSLDALWPRLGRRIVIYRHLVDVTGSVKAALFLSQCLYWTRRGRDTAQRGGWFHKTAEQWTRETGLTLREQMHVRALLRQAHLLAEARMGIPACLHFRVGMNPLRDALAKRPGYLEDHTPVREGDAFLARLGPAVSYQRALAELEGGVHAALLLSHVLYELRRLGKAPEATWLPRPATVWQGQIGLTRREHEGTRRGLADAGLWEEALIGVPPRLHVRLQVLRLRRFLESAPTVALDVAGRSDVPALEGIGDAQNVESSGRESRHQDLREAPSQICVNAHHSFAQSDIPHMLRITRVELQENPYLPSHAREQSAAIPPSPAAAGWVFPEGLLLEEQDIARDIVATVPHLAQLLLDELSGHMRGRRLQGSPIAYLRVLAEKALAGSFIPYVAHRVAAERRRESIAQAQRASEARRAERQRHDPNARQRIVEHLRRMRSAIGSADPPASRDADEEGS